LLDYGRTDGTSLEKSAVLLAPGRWQFRVKAISVLGVSVDLAKGASVEIPVA